MANKINDVPRVELLVHANADLVFHVEWWSDKAMTTPVPLSAVDGAIAGGGERHVLAPFSVIVGNRASVRVPAATINAWAAFDQGQWEYILVALSGERRKVGRGPAKLTKGV